MLFGTQCLHSSGFIFPSLQGGCCWPVIFGKEVMSGCTELVLTHTTLSGEVPECLSGLGFMHLAHPHSQGLFSSKHPHLLLSRSSTSSQKHLFFSARSLLSRLGALTFPSLNGLRTELQKVISLLSSGPFSYSFTDKRIQDVPFLFRPELIKIYSQPLLLQQTDFLLDSSVWSQTFPKTKDSWNGLDWKWLESLVT